MHGRPIARVVSPRSRTVVFTAHLLSARGLLPARDGAELPASGVFLPESLFESANARAALLERLLAVEGTLNWAFEVSEATGVKSVRSALGQQQSS